MAFPLIMEALARVEHKLDALLRHLKVPAPPPMHFVGAACPTCLSLIDYQVDLQHGVVVRKCNCKTGKVPTKFELLPITPDKEKSRGRPEAGDEADDGAVGAEGGARRR